MSATITVHRTRDGQWHATCPCGGLDFAVPAADLGDTLDAHIGTIGHVHYARGYAPASPTIALGELLIDDIIRAARTDGPS